MSSAEPRVTNFCSVSLFVTQNIYSKAMFPTEMHRIAINQFMLQNPYRYVVKYIVQYKKCEYCRGYQKIIPRPAPLTKEGEKLQPPPLRSSLFP